MNYSYYIIDSFTDIAFGGVPVAVFPEADDIPAAYFKALSEEFVACDTVFISQLDPENGRYGFDCYDENGRCMVGAHELIAGLAALLEHSSQARDRQHELKIDTIEDCIQAFVDPESKRFPFVFKRKITPEVDHFVPRKSDIATIIGLAQEDIASAHYTCSIASCDNTYLFVPLKSYHAVREAELNTTAWSASSLPASLVDKIVIFAPNTDKTGADFHMRLLKRGAALKSDPAVGEALSAFAGYLSSQASVQKGTHSLTIRRGENEGRQSILHLEIDNVKNGPLQMRVGGSAIVTALGKMICQKK